jgi:hypothetical protein
MELKEMDIVVQPGRTTQVLGVVAAVFENGARVCWIGTIKHKILSVWSYFPTCTEPLYRLTLAPEEYKEEAMLALTIGKFTKAL